MGTIEPVAQQNKQLVWMFLVHGILLAIHPGSNMGSEENSRRRDNKEKGGFLVIANCVALCVSTPSRTFGYDCEHANDEC
jgi:hypothetical protein